MLSKASRSAEDDHYLDGSMVDATFASSYDGVALCAALEAAAAGLRQEVRLDQ
jgi:hypothetical protein